MISELTGRWMDLLTNRPIYWLVGWLIGRMLTSTIPRFQACWARAQLHLSSKSPSSLPLSGETLHAFTHFCCHYNALIMIIDVSGTSSQMSPRCWQKGLKIKGVVVRGGVDILFHVHIYTTTLGNHTNTMQSYWKDTSYSACMCVCVCVCVHMQMYAQVKVSVHVHACVYVCVCMCVCLHIQMYAQVKVCVCMHVSNSVCMWVKQRVCVRFYLGDWRSVNCKSVS